VSDIDAAWRDYKSHWHCSLNHRADEIMAFAYKNGYLQGLVAAMESRDEDELRAITMVAIAHLKAIAAIAQAELSTMPCK